MDTSLTQALADRARNLSFSDVPQRTRVVAGQIVLDWLGVTLAGASDPSTVAVSRVMRAQGGDPVATVVGRNIRLPAISAALVNGTAAHALDYDDVSFAIPGHASCPVLAAVFALAETLGSSGEEFLLALIAGYELSCRVGVLVAPDHYKRGFHATATVGCFGATAACGRLLGLDASQMAQALGIAATRAAGLKASFGTSCKPLQAGNAASTGVLCALLAQAGLDAPSDTFDHRMGFSSTYAGVSNLEVALGTPGFVHDFSLPPVVGNRQNAFHLDFNLFKYHVACYETHSTIECGQAIGAMQGFRLGDIESVKVRVNRHANDICNIQAPRADAETRFSLRQAATFALGGLSTATIDTFCLANANRADLLGLRGKVTVELCDDVGLPVTEMEVALASGQRLAHRHDSSKPMADLDAQQTKLQAKFEPLALPFIGRDRVKELIAMTKRLEQLPSIADLAGGLNATVPGQPA